MTYVKVNDTLYPATVEGRMSDTGWEGRKSKTIRLSMSYDEAVSLFVNNTPWSIVMDVSLSQPVLNEAGEATGEYTLTQTQEEYDNSEYCIAGDLTDHRDGSVSVKMGMLTELEQALKLLLGGEESV